MHFVPESIKKEWINNGFLKSLCMKNALFLNVLPEEYHTDDLLAHACKQKGMIKLIPKDHPKKNEWLLSAFKINPNVISSIPEEIITLAMSESACKERRFQYQPHPRPT